MGDELVIDGGMATFEVVEKIGIDLRCKCTDPGLLLPRAKLSFWRDGRLVGRSDELPTLSAKVIQFSFPFCPCKLCDITYSPGIEFARVSLFCF